MLCCSYDCEKYVECAHACINNPNSTDYIVDWARNGSCSIQYVNGQVVTNENYDCGAVGKYAMYTPYIKLTIPEHYHQITIDEWIEEKEKQDLNMNDLYYMQFSNMVLETMKTAKQALTKEEYNSFLKSVQRLCKLGGAK